MKVLITRGFCLGHGIDVFPGDTVEVEDAKALLLIRQGRAEEAPEGEEEKAKAKTKAEKKAEKEAAEAEEEARKKAPADAANKEKGE